MVTSEDVDEAISPRIYGATAIQVADYTARITVPDDDSEAVVPSCTRGV